MKYNNFYNCKKSEFILNYKENGNKIVVKYANGNTVEIANTEKNHEILEKSMKEQVKSVDKFINEKKFIFTTSIFSIVFLYACAAISIKNLFFSPEGFSVLSPIFLAISAFFGVDFTVELISIAKAMKDREKNLKFLEVEEKLNNKVKENENILYNTHNVTKKIVEENKGREVTFTINNIDKVPFKDLNQMMINVDREEKFGFESLEQEKTKKLTK